MTRLSAEEILAAVDAARGKKDRIARALVQLADACVLADPEVQKVLALAHKPSSKNAKQLMRVNMQLFDGKTVPAAKPLPIPQLSSAAFRKAVAATSKYQKFAASAHAERKRR